MYHPEPYWNKVAREIAEREGENVIAGDDEPYYRYKREKFLKLFHQVSFSGKKVLEIGSGPGGNLREVLKHEPNEIHGVDISEEMVAIAKKHLVSTPAVVQKIDGQVIPYSDRYFDLSFTSTVLQHNTDEVMLDKLVGEICRVTAHEIYLFERIEKTIKGDELNLGRPVGYYQKLLEKNGFTLRDVKYLDIQISYLVSGAIRKLFNKPGRKEGEKISRLSDFLQKICLPFTSILDKIFKSKREVARLHFERKL